MKFPQDLGPSSIIFILRTLGPQASARLLFSRLLSLNHFYIVGRSLATLDAPPAAGPTMSPVTTQDFDWIAERLPSFDAMDRRELLSRILFYQKGFTNCYAIRQGDDLAYLQWIVFPEENALIERNYSGIYYPLSAKQVMIENAFTFPRYRGRSLFQEGTRQLLEVAKTRGYNSAIAYIRKDRIDPLNLFAQMGFKIVKMVTEYKLLGRAWKTF